MAHDSDETWESQILDALNEMVGLLDDPRELFRRRELLRWVRKLLDRSTEAEAQAAKELLTRGLEQPGLSVELKEQLTRALRILEERPS